MQPDLAHTHHFTRAVVQLGDKRPVVARTPIFNTQGLKIIDKGVTVDARLYERLTQHQLRSPLDECVDSEPGVSGSIVRDEARLLCGTDRFFGAMLAQLREPAWFFEELALLPLPRPVAFQLTVMREVRPELWQHSLRSMVCAAWLVTRLGGTRHDARMLAASGLLHDLGMLHLDPVLTQPSMRLNREQQRQLDAHPLLAAMALERHHVYPKEALQAVLEHHEALDGSGYPRHLGAAQSPWGRLLALSELVVSLTASSHVAPALRLSVALRMNAQRFDADARVIVTDWLRPLAETPPDGDAAADPAGDLRHIDELLQGWQAAATAATAPEADPARMSAAQRISELCDALHKTLVAAGATPELLAMLDSAPMDRALTSELVLIAREAAWQLRTVARQARRRWELRTGEAFPTALQGWLDEVDAFCEAALER